MANPPAFPMYAQDALVGCALMSCTDFGAYMRLLFYQWVHGGIPDCPKAMRTLTGAKVSAEVLAKFRKCEDGMLRNDRMEEERAKQQAFRDRQRSNGNLGGRPKLTQDKPKTNPLVNPNETPHEQTPQDESESEESSFCRREGIGEGMRGDSGFPEAWRKWREYRAEKGEPLTSFTAKAQLLKCARAGAKKAVTMINLAIEKGWKNLLEPHEMQHQTPVEQAKPKPKLSQFDQQINDVKRVLEDWENMSEGERTIAANFIKTLSPSALQAYFNENQLRALKKIAA